MQTEQIQTHGNLWQNLQSSMIVISLGVFLASCVLAGKYPVMSVFALVASILYILSTFSFWRKKSSARSGILIFIASMIFLLTANKSGELNLLAVFVRYSDVMLLLVGIALLRQVMNAINFNAALGAYLLQKKPSRVTLSITLLTAFLTWPMSLGAIPLLLDSLKKVVQPKFNLAKIVTRTVCITMVLMPTTIGAAAVWAAMPDIPHVPAMLVGIPLFLFSILLNQKSRVQLVAEDSHTVSDRGNMTSILAFIGLFWGSFILSLSVLGLNPLQSITFTAVVLFIVSHFANRKKQWAQQLSESAQGISGEVVLLLACSLLTSVCMMLFANIPQGITAFVSGLTTFQCYAIILFVLPLPGILGIHPLIIFSVSWSIFSDYLSGSVVDYQIWICLFIATQLLSPVSINAIFAANSLNVSPGRTSFQMHYGYVLLFNLFALSYLGALSTII
ncbi:hypothetical protein [Citrobacter cronae]|uniref:hypothetical protein n=1 Tax=Citrobacter cronae TaxID=1748967 RepID=UPI00190143B2|nr:hypothetical protein [Citrobacter cronae]MBJ8367260.1 hypothetical protein [Citrobacter cronae]MBJ8394608.1 hypothetical protein [Citrobacter cronae]MBJ8409025.1 hypothetical protein [Citrobacter cronae]